MIAVVACVCVVFVVGCVCAEDVLPALLATGRDPQQHHDANKEANLKVKKGELDKIIAETESMGAFENLLLGNRNQNWIPKIQQITTEKPTFFAVGAGHLGGKKGVIALLKEAGFTVKAIKN